MYARKQLLPLYVIRACRCRGYVDLYVFLVINHQGSQNRRLLAMILINDSE
jgi:hypothetical protein